MTYPRIAALLAAAAGLAALQPVLAADLPAPAGFVRTGETDTCVSVRRLDSTKILNSKQILFTMKNGDTWLNEPGGCPGMSKNAALAYEVHAGQICNTTIVTLIEPAGAMPSVRGSCGLSKFEKLERQSAAAE